MIARYLLGYTGYVSNVTTSCCYENGLVLFFNESEMLIFTRLYSRRWHSQHTGVEDWQQTILRLSSFVKLEQRSMCYYKMVHLSLLRTRCSIIWHCNPADCAVFTTCVSHLPLHSQTGWLYDSRNIKCFSTNISCWLFIGLDQLDSVVSVYPWSIKRLSSLEYTHHVTQLD